MFPPGSEKIKTDKDDAYCRIRKVRKDNKLTQEQFAEKIGYSTVLVHMIEFPVLCRGFVHCYCRENEHH